MERLPRLFFAALLLEACTATPPALGPGAGASSGGAGPQTADAGRSATGGTGGGTTPTPESSGGSPGTGGAPVDDPDDDPPAGGAGLGGSAGPTGGRTGRGGSGGANDAGVSGGGKDAAAPTDTNYATPVVCTSGDHWTNGDRGALAMYPGRPCIACHALKRGPAFSAAGTIFATAHEPDDCNGVDGLFTGAAVVITDATGKVFTTGANLAGNFEFFTINDKIVPPYRAKVIAANGKERVMATPQMMGDCNVCHTVAGTMAAPGRIMLP
jgi:hypothetical protein